MIMRNLNKYKKRFVFCFLVVLTLIILLNPNYNARRNYEYISKEDIWDNLFIHTTRNLSTSVIAECYYEDILFEERTLAVGPVDGDLIEGHHIREGGEYAPIECKPKFSTAIIVPYRDCAEQLRDFLVYMHTFLRQQRIHYRLYVVEQVDSRPFNRAKLMNVGAQYAMKAGYPCLVFHDVYLLPLQTANLYACTKQPRHLSSSINKFRFVLPYINLFGGVIAITSNQFKAVNGMSNEYFGWDGEDDDFYMRLEAKSLKLCRFEPTTSRYHMAVHRTEPKGMQSQELLASTKERMLTDGLNSLKYTAVATVLHPLFTHIMVDL